MSALADQNISDEILPARPFRPLRKRIVGWQVFYCVLVGFAIAALQLGTTWYGRHDANLRAIALDALLILGCQLLGGMALALLMARVHSQLVASQLTDIAHHLSSLNPVSLKRPLLLARPPGRWRDEFDQLCEAFNTLNEKLVFYIDTHRELEAQLRRHRNELTLRIAERTMSLERLKEFHSLIISMLTRFMNLPAQDAGAAVDQGLSAFCEHFRVERCILFELEEEGSGFRVAHAWPPLERDGVPTEVWLAADELEQEPGSEASEFKTMGARIWLAPGDAMANSPAAAAEPPQDEAALAQLEPSPCTIVGVEILDRTVGLLCLVGEVLAPDSDDARMLELAARVAANMLDHKLAQSRLAQAQDALQTANRELHTLSHYDALTGLANRRRFDEVKATEFSRALRGETPLAVLMCDIDHFKRYNDTYGHAMGDACLKALADCLAGLFARAGELPARLGGEEFAVLLPGATAELALAAAERLRLTVWELNLPHAGSLVADRVTLSIGVACLVHGVHADFDMLLRDADAALYRAKETRNSVAMAPDAPES